MARYYQEVEARIFPYEGKRQIDLRNWVKSHGGYAELWDGVIEHTNGNFRWKMMGIKCQGVMHIVKIGEYVLHDLNGNFRVVDHDTLEKTYILLPRT